MSLLILIILVVGLIFFLKTKKIKNLYKILIKKENILIVLYEQKFENLLKLINLENLNIQESIFINIAEMRKESLFFIKNNDNNSFFILEEKIQSILKSIEKNKIFITNINDSEIASNIKNIDNLIEATKLEYNNLIDHYNQETNDFFGKQIKKQIKNLKKFNYI
jgi:hypothetical protein